MIEQRSGPSLANTPLDNGAIMCRCLKTAQTTRLAHPARAGCQRLVALTAQTTIYWGEDNYARDPSDSIGGVTPKVKGRGGE